ncbi:MAG: hypothetical protein AAF436_06670 [Myxococcota bacterium]
MSALDSTPAKRATIRERFNYRFERFLARGGISIFAFLVILFIGSLVVAVALRALILVFAPEFDLFQAFSDHVWVTFLEMTDPGNMARDTGSPTAVKIATVVSGFLGVVIFSMLIAFITTTLEDTLAEFRKGRGKVIERGHTLILGWNERVVGILSELVLANESERDASVVILADADKDRMNDEIVKALPDTKTTRVIISQGNPVSLSELTRVGAPDARSVIVLANCGEMASDAEKGVSDTRAIKVIMALIAAQGGANQLPIVAEIFQQEMRQLATIFRDDNIITLDSWEIMGKLFVQTALTSGLEMVYNEILSFAGAEVYFHRADWRGVKFGDLALHLRDGVPLGILDGEGTLSLRPPADQALANTDQALILAEDDSTIAFSKDALYRTRDFPYTHRRLDEARRRVLVLGWHEIGDIIVSESSDYLADGSVFDIMQSSPSLEMGAHVTELGSRFPSLQIRLHEGDPMSYDELLQINPFSYDNVVILSQTTGATSPEQVDSDTLMILLLLRKIADERGHRAEERATKIITQVLNAENQALIVQTDVDDFIISNKLITMILAQLSEQPAIKLFYDDIFQEDGSEIYVKPAPLYFESLPLTLSFVDIMGQAAKRGEICLGIRRGKLRRDAAANFGVRLNLRKDEQVEIAEDDFLVVLAEDER